ncbi:MAG: hypothetical protein ACRD01_03245 [Terriglobales bacterium]
MPFDMPKFASEAEEAAWWQRHRREADELFERAYRVGAVRRFKGGGEVPTMQTTIRLIVRDVERARAIAQRKGLRYQTYIKMLVHEGLNQEEAARPPFSGRPPAATAARKRARGPGAGRAAAGIRLAATRTRPAERASKLPRRAG